MGYLRVALLIAVLVGVGLCCGTVMADGEPGDVCEPGYEPTTTGDWALIVPSYDTVVEAGAEVQFRLMIVDTDCHGTPTRSDELTIDDWPFPTYQDEYGTYYAPSPTSTPPDNVDIMSEDGGTVKQYHVTFNDTPDWYDDPDPSAIDIKVTWVGVADIVGERNTCKSAGGGSYNEQIYSVITNPAGHEDMVTWTVTGAFSASEDQDHQMHVYMPVDAGTVTVTATCGTSSETKTIYVSTLPDPNDTPSAGGGGGGCSSGGCGSSGIWPAPCMWCPTFQPVPDFGCCDCGDGSCGFSCCGGGGTDDSDAEDDSVDDLMCGSLYLGFQYTDAQGRQYNLLSAEGDDLPLGGLSILSRSSDQNGLTTGYTMTSADGTVTQYGTPVKPSQSSSLGRSRKTSVTDADGRVTTYNRDTNGALLSKVLPNGDSYTFEHALGGTKVTEVTAPDSTYTTVSYVDGGIADGKVESVDKYDGTDTLLSHAEYDYDGFGRLTSATVNGRVMTYAYSGSTITMTDTSADPQIVTTYEYGSDDGIGITTVTRKHCDTPSLDQTTTYYFFTRGGKNAYLWKVQDPTGAWTTYGTYVLAGTTVDGTEHEDYEFAPDDNPNLVGKVFRVKDDLNHVTTSDYDSDTGALVEVTHPDSSTEEYQYYLDGQSNKTRWLKTTKNVRGNYTHYVRNTGTLHRVDAVQVDDDDADWATDPVLKSYTYYTSGQQTGLIETETVADIDGYEDYYKTYSYLKDIGGGQYRLEPGPTEVSYRWWNNDSQNPQYVDKTDTTAYDVMGRVLSTTDANSRVVSNTYDAQGRQLTTTYGASGPYTESHYNCCVLEWTRDEEGRYTYYAYDDAKRVTDVRTSAQASNEKLVHYEYDCFGNAATVTTYSDASTGRTTTYTYDKNNRVVRIDYPTVAQGQDPLAPELFQYDAVGNLIGKRVGESGSITAYEYDNLNRLVKVEYDYESWPVNLTSNPIDEPAVTYAYYGGSRLRETMVDASGTSEYQYDERNRLVGYKPPKPADHDWIYYTYNNLNQKIEILHDWNTINYEYYANGWLKDVTYGSTVATLTYDQVGNRTRIDRLNGTYTLYGYDTDPRYRITSSEHRRQYPTDVQLGEILYNDRDDSGNPTEIEDWDGTVNYAYDNNNRLDSETGADYNYDWVGNRLNPPANPSPMVYDATDKLVSWPSTHQYTYYPTGSLYQQKSSGGTVQKTFSYNGAELLSSVTHAGVNDPSQMVWDGDGNRVSFTSSTGGTTEFVYDPTASIPAVIEEMIGETPICYIREPSGALLMRTDGTSYQHYLFDALGSTRMLTDISGNVTDKYAYDAWGQFTAHTTYTGSIDQPYLFVGRAGYYSHYQDASLFDEFGQQLLQLGVRFYDPQIGRFVTSDPIRQGVNYYTYVVSLPVSQIDPSGLYAESVSAERYQLCTSKGGYLEEWVYCTKKKAVNKWEALKCVGKLCGAFAWDALKCLAECGPAGLGGAQGYATCVMNCMSMQPMDASKGADADEFITCIKDSYEEQKPRRVKTCTGTINDYNQGVRVVGTFLDSEPPIGSDWKRCDKDK